MQTQGVFRGGEGGGETGGVDGDRQKILRVRFREGVSNLSMHILCEVLSFNLFRSCQCEILDALKLVLCDSPS